MKVSILALLIAFILIGSTMADIPRLISYQGKVTDTGGSPVADGSYNMRFRIYDSLTGGSLEWDSGVHSVQVTGGVFNVLLGESPQPALNLYFDEDYWLLVTFAGVNQTPRQRLASVAYAYMASGLVPGTLIQGSVSSVTSSAIKAVNTATSGMRYGGSFETAASSGRAVYGFASHSSGVTYGGKFHSHSTSGIGVYGLAEGTTGTNYGGYFETASGSGIGVYGVATATTITNYGGRFVSASSSGRGVFGEVTATSGQTYGVYGLSASTSGRGVVGYTSTSSGYTYGVYGLSASTYGMGVYGEASALSGYTHGVYGKSVSTDGRGVRGEASAISGYTHGIRGLSASTSGKGVSGEASASTGQTYGVYGESASAAGAGVEGKAAASSGLNWGVYGWSVSPNGKGVQGLGAAVSGFNYGIYGATHSPSGYGVYSSGNFGASGTKSCVVKTSQGPTLLYCQESPENWFEDFGEGRLVNGRCHIELDPLFLETVTIDDANPMKVFVTLNGRCRWVYVERGSTGFDVIEQDDGTSNVGFCYRVVAKRKGFEDKRLDYCTAAQTDSYLYPELREKEIGERGVRP